MARSAPRSLSWRRRHGPEALLHPFDPTILSLVKALIAVSKEITSCKKPQVFQRRTTTLIIRKVSMLSLLFEEIKASGTWLPPSALLCFRELHVTFQGIKVLLNGCREASNLWSLMEQEDLAKQFHHLTQRISTALDGLPYELLDVSEEVREQTDLVQRQARKAEVHIDPKEKQLRLDVLSVMEEFEREATPDPAKLKDIFHRLHLNDVVDCERELLLLEKEREHLKISQRVADINSLISFVRYSRCVLYGLVEEEETANSLRTSGASNARKVGLSGNEDEEEAGLSIPDDFKCPISLDLMVDPVVVATGQTYDRASINRWMEDGHSTCPKSGLELLHKNLIPNSTLRSLITQWCKEHNFVLESVEKPGKSKIVYDFPSNRASLEATKLTAAFLVEKLSTGTAEVQRQVAYELRLLAKCGMDNRRCIAEAGAIPCLVTLLTSTDPRTQENAVTALLNISIHEKNKETIMEAREGLDTIIKVVRQGSTMEARENAAATLFSLSAAKDYKVTIGSKPGAIEGLVELLREATERGKRDAASTLFNLSLHKQHGEEVVRAGAIPVLVYLLSSRRTTAELAANVVGVMSILARTEEGLAAMRASPCISVELMKQLREGNAKAKENSIAVLLALCRSSGGSYETVRSVLNKSSWILPSLQSSLARGTPRARRKAASLLRFLQQWENSTIPH